MPFHQVIPDDTQRSCADCKSCLTGDTYATVYRGSNPGVPVCGSFGWVLGVPGEPKLTENLQVKKASACSAYNFDLPSPMPERLEMMVAMPDTKVILSGYTDENVRTDSCVGCKNLISPEAVKDNFGFKWPMCAATGRLISPNRYTKEAADCEYSERGTPREFVTGITLMPEYGGKINLTSMLLQVEHADPTVYASDKPVTPGEAAMGVRAWRKIVDPDMYGEDLYLPIMRSDIFTDAERELIPQTGDATHPEWYIDHAGLTYAIVAEWMGLDETPALQGHAGVGKTQAGVYLAWLAQMPFIRVSIDGETDTDDIFGKFLFEGNETVWINGRVSEWWEKPCVLLIDEPNTAQDAVWQRIRPMTEAMGKRLVLDASKGEKRERGIFTFLLLAMNPAWDPKYIGAREISWADGERLSHFWLDLPPEDLERKIIVQYCEQDEYTPAPDLLDTVMGIARDIRLLVDAGSLPISWGIRPQIKVLRKTKYMNLMNAYRRSITDGLEPETGRMILSIVNTHTGLSVPTMHGAGAAAAQEPAPY